MQGPIRVRDVGLAVDAAEHLGNRGRVGDHTHTVDVGEVAAGQNGPRSVAIVDLNKHKTKHARLKTHHSINAVTTQHCAISPCAAITQ